jgi:hypothetical protein
VSVDAERLVAGVNFQYCHLYHDSLNGPMKFISSRVHSPWCMFISNSLMRVLIHLYSNNVRYIQQVN